MTSQPLDLTVLRTGRKQAAFTAEADPAVPAQLQAILETWLTGEKWGRSLWPQFELAARPAGRWKIAATVRAS